MICLSPDLGHSGLSVLNVSFIYHLPQKPLWLDHIILRLFDI